MCGMCLMGLGAALELSKMATPPCILGGLGLTLGSIYGGGKLVQYFAKKESEQVPGSRQAIAFKVAKWATLIFTTLATSIGITLTGAGVFFATWFVFPRTTFFITAITMLALAVFGGLQLGNTTASVLCPHRRAVPAN